jgi:predicted ATPase/DNA-binding CsgD family transcriptional regulator/tRNA A-37 threonylcarbamoyl transferase component Bud32
MSLRMEQRLGNYILRRLVGAGAFADVYLGMHIYLNSRVAIKVLHTHVNALTWESFLSEARHLSQLEHANIISVLDFSIEDDDPFLVMDYAPGGNLRQRHPSGVVVPLPMVLSYVKTIASALQYTHDQHLIHRDLKPENLLVGEQGEILLSDFGLALITASTDRLQVPERFGTLAYMAPEQIKGQASAASDQYALAVMIYEWLSGRRPFEGTLEQLTNQHLFATPASLRSQHPEIPAAVEQAVFRALSKEPSLRFADVLSFATAIEVACHPVAASLSLSPPSAGEVSATEPARTAPSGPHPYIQNLPVPLTPLIGRERELRLARARLLRPGLRLLTLVGIPGVGKTHLALWLAAQLQETFIQGVCFVGLSTISDPNQVAPTILHALGLPESKEAAPSERLVACLREKRLLLILDTFEQVLPAAPLLTELLSSCPLLTILVTSRAALHVQGENELAVPPLALPNLRVLPAPDSLAKVAAVSLFVERAEALKPGFALSERNAALIAELCVQLGGVPLAIELAAARCKHLSLEAMLARLKQGLGVLAGRNQNVPPRQQTLRNTIAWSYDLLSAEEQLIFRRLCIFFGEFSLEAAEVVAEAPDRLSTLSPLDGIISLVDKSLLLKGEVEEGEPRLYLLKIIRAYGLEWLAECGELEDCRRAHAMYYLALVERHQAGLSGAEQFTWLKQVEVAYENILAALQWLQEHCEREAALRLLIALQKFWLLHGRLREDHAFLDHAYAHRYSEESLALLRKMGSPYGAAQVMVVLACELVALGEPSRARNLLQEALSLASTRENSEVLVHVLCGAAHLELQLGHMEAGRTCLAKAIANMQGSRLGTNSTWLLAIFLEWLGELALEQGQAVWAVQLYAAAERVRGADGYYSLLEREQANNERTLAEALCQLGGKAYTAAWAEGQTLSLQQLIMARTSSPTIEEARPSGQAARWSAATLDHPGGLTPREVEVLRLLGQGLSNHQIAERLVLSPYTVNSHIQSIYGKLMINSRSAATRFALDHHLL